MTSQRSLTADDLILSVPLGDDVEGTRQSGFGHGCSFLVVFLWAFLGVGTMVCAWSFATPIGAAPDEPAHVAQAAAVVRGQFDGPTRHYAIGELGIVRVPGWAADNWAPCFVKDDAFTDPKQTGVAAACGDTVITTTTPASAATQFFNAPPLYYLVAGIPSLFLSGEPALYAMRVLPGLLNAALVALGIALLARYHPRRAPLVGALIALTPMVLFVMAVVNSSGLEISSGFATWCGALCVAEYPQLPRALAIWTAVAAVLLVLSRPTSALDLAAVVVVMAFFIGWRRLRERLNRTLAPLWIPVVVAVVVAGGFILVCGSPHLTGVAPAHPVGLLSNMWTNLRQTGADLRQCIGNFGWLDTPVPMWVVIVWGSCVAGLVALALALSASCRRALPVLVLSILALPEVLFAPEMNTFSGDWQGRYWLPLAVGIPLVASTFRWPVRSHVHRRTDRERIAPALVLGLGLVLFAAQLGSFTHALTRYETGLGVRAGAPTVWLPPGGHDPVVIAFVVGSLLTLALVVFMMLPRMKFDSVRGSAPTGACR